MTKYQEFYSGISKVAWGYFFIYINVFINNINLIPTFVGYVLILSAIRLLKEEVRELSFLHAPGMMMVLWTGADWFASLVGIRIMDRWQFVDIIIGLVNLYFHFQLITNLSYIATKYQPQGYELDTKLLRYRTLQTVMLTAIEIVSCFQSWLSEAWTIITVIMLLSYIVACFGLMKILFEFRTYLRRFIIS